MYQKETYLIELGHFKSAIGEDDLTPCQLHEVLVSAQEDKPMLSKCFCRVILDNVPEFVGHDPGFQAVWPWQPLNGTFVRSLFLQIPLEAILGGSKGRNSIRDVSHH